MWAAGFATRADRCRTPACSWGSKEIDEARGVREAVPARHLGRGPRPRQLALCQRRGRRRRHLLQPDAGRQDQPDDQHRLRAGRGRSAAHEPRALSAVLPGEARFLPRRSDLLRLPEHGCQRQLADSLLHAPHRAEPGMRTDQLEAARRHSAARCLRECSADRRERAIGENFPCCAGSTAVQRCTSVRSTHRPRPERASTRGTPSAPLLLATSSPRRRQHRARRFSSTHQAARPRRIHATPRRSIERPVSGSVRYRESRNYDAAVASRRAPASAG